jgi:CDP-diacylglycerol--glycerol-3-phosphate 3-phosphatidyltransferase
VLAALPDLLDGALAKASDQASQRGAFFDSTVDRVTDAVLFGGVTWYVAGHESAHLTLLPFSIMALSMLVLTAVTAVQRFVKVWRQAQVAPVTAARIEQRRSRRQSRRVARGERRRTRVPRRRI